MRSINEALELQGFAVVEDVLDQAEVEDLIAAFELDASDDSAMRRASSMYGLRDIFRKIPAAANLVRTSAMRSLVEPILGPNAFAVRGLFFDKTPGANWNLPWHRDQTITVKRRVEQIGFGPWTLKRGIPHAFAPRDVLNRMLTARIHLDDTGEDNGPLKVVPGSHAPAALERIEADWMQGVEPVTCKVKRGGALLMRPLLLHTSSHSSSPTHRRVIHIEFAADRLPGGLEWFEMIGLSS